jgi:hypothetical protein
MYPTGLCKTILNIESGASTRTLLILALQWRPREILTEAINHSCGVLHGSYKKIVFFAGAIDHAPQIFLRVFLGAGASARFLTFTGSRQYYSIGNVCRRKPELQEEIYATSERGTLSISHLLTCQIPVHYTFHVARFGLIFVMNIGQGHSNSPNLGLNNWPNHFSHVQHVVLCGIKTSVSRSVRPSSSTVVPKKTQNCACSDG